MIPLLRRCLELHEQDAWTDLFRLVEAAATPQVRWVLSRTGVSRMETEELVLELVEQLYQDDCRKLRSCRARSEAELGAWLRQVALRFAWKWVHRHQRGVPRKPESLSVVEMPELSGLDERALEARLAEWELLMAPKDFDRLLMLLGRATTARAACRHTQCRWARHLMKKYAHLFAD